MGFGVQTYKDAMGTLIFVVTVTGWGVDPKYILLTHRQKATKQGTSDSGTTLACKCMGYVKFPPGDVRNLSQGNKSCTGEAPKNFSRRRPPPPLGRFTCRLCRRWSPRRSLYVYKWSYGAPINGVSLWVISTPSYEGW